MIMVIRIRYLAIIVILLVSSVALVLLHSSKLSAKLYLEVTPIKGSKIEILNKEYQTGQSSLSPGSYTVIFTHPGFTEVKKAVSLRKGDSRYIGVSLIPNDPSTVSWYTSHQLDRKLTEGISSKNYDQIFKDQLSSLPLIKELPFIDLLYRVDYGRSLKTNSPNAVALYIKFYSPTGKQQALDWLKYKGYDPNKLEIIYTDSSAGSE